MGELTPMERAELTREFVNRMIILETDLDIIIEEMAVKYRPGYVAKDVRVTREKVEMFLEDLADLLTEPRGD